MDSDKYLSFLLAWCRSNGLDAAKDWGLRPHVFASGLRGVQVAAPEAHLKLKDGAAGFGLNKLGACFSADGTAEYPTVTDQTPLLRIPHHLMMTVNLALATNPFVGAIAKLAFAIGNSLSETEILALFLIEQRRLFLAAKTAGEHFVEQALSVSSAANWLPYVATVPRSYDTTIFWQHIDFSAIGVHPHVCAEDVAVLHEDCASWRASHRGVLGVLTDVAAALSLALAADTSPEAWSLPISRAACATLLRSPLFTAPPVSALTPESVPSDTAATAAPSDAEFLWALATIGTRTVYTPPLAAATAGGTGSGSGLCSWAALQTLAGAVTVPALRPSDADDTPAPAPAAAAVPSAPARSLTAARTVGDTYALAHTGSTAALACAAGSRAEFAAATAELARYALSGRAADPAALVRSPHTRHAEAVVEVEKSTDAAAGGAAAAAATLARICASVPARGGGSSQEFFTPTCALVPFFDLLNHSSRARVAVQWVAAPARAHAAAAAAATAVVAKAVSGPMYELALEPGSLRPVPLLCTPGAAPDADAASASEAFISYGPLSNLTLLQRYGFVLPGGLNGHDCVRVSLRCVEALLAQLGSDAVPALTTTAFPGWTVLFPSALAPEGGGEAPTLLGALPGWQRQILEAAGQFTLSHAQTFDLAAADAATAAAGGGLGWRLWLYLCVRLLPRSAVESWGRGEPTALAAATLALGRAVTTAPGAASLGQLTPGPVACAVNASHRVSVAGDNMRTGTCVGVGVGVGVRRLLPAARPPVARPTAARPRNHTAGPARTPPTGGNAPVDAGLARRAAERLLEERPLDGPHGAHVRAAGAFVLAQVRACLAAPHTAGAGTCPALGGCPLHTRVAQDRSALASGLRAGRLGILDACLEAVARTTATAFVAED